MVCHKRSHRLRTRLQSCPSTLITSSSAGACSQVAANSVPASGTTPRAAARAASGAAVSCGPQTQMVANTAWPARPSGEWRRPASASNSACSRQTSRPSRWIRICWAQRPCDQCSPAARRPSWTMSQLSHRLSRSRLTCSRWRPGPLEQQGFLRQPFQTAAAFQLEVDGLQRLGVDAAVPLAGSRRGQQDMGLIAQANIQSQLIAAGNAARRMQQQAMAAGRSLRIKQFLDAQRSAVATLGGAGLTTPGFEAQSQLGMPGGNRPGGGAGDGGVEGDSHVLTLTVRSRVSQVGVRPERGAQRREPELVWP